MAFQKLKDFVKVRLARSGRRWGFEPTLQIITEHKIDCVLDVGANTGQFAEGLRQLGYKGQIESFEPLPEEFKTLEAVTKGDNKWNAHAYALGDAAQTREMNALSHSPSSSFLELSREVNLDSFKIETVKTIPVEIKRLDDIFSSVTRGFENIYLKIDVQGFEEKVIAGATESLKSIAAVQLETSLIRQYHGELLIEETIALMRSHGFNPWWIVDGFKNRKPFQLYQADVIFVKSAG